MGLYHTAGKGTRLAPLPGAENNNKPGVKLPAPILIGDKVAPITILEAVIKQTGCYARSRPGRLSVFWGDQVFIPTVPVEYCVTHHIDILCSLGPMMSESEWREKGMDKYGLIAQNASGGAAQVEKVDHATAVQLLANLGEIKSVGASLGSFSVSSLMLFALLEEFDDELTNKRGKLDSDPHLWMPMTLDKAAYLQLMGQKGVAEEFSDRHFDRIAAMMRTFNEGPTSHLGLFGPVNVGQGVFWWDYGQLRLYQQNTLLMADTSPESDLIRLFYGFGDERIVAASELKNTSIDALSCVSSSKLGSESTIGSITRSVLSHVDTHQIEADGAVLINVTARRIIARPGSIAYNVVDSSAEGLTLEEGQILAGVTSADGQQMLMRSRITIDGGKAWETLLEGNAMSFEDVYNSNADVCPRVIEAVNARIHEDSSPNRKTTLSVSLGESSA